MATQPATETMKISAVKQQLNQLVNRVYRRETRVLVRKERYPGGSNCLAADLRRLERLDQERAERFKILDEIGETFKDIPPEALEKEIERTLAEVRAERRAEHSEAIEEFAAGFADQTPEEIERETARAIAEVRAERRQAAAANEVIRVTLDTNPFAPGHLKPPITECADSVSPMRCRPSIARDPRVLS